MSDLNRKAVQDAIQADFESMNAATSASVGLTSMQYGRDDVQSVDNVISSATAATPDASMHSTSNVIEDDAYM